MKTYLVQLPSKELKIFTVQPEQEEAFLKEHSQNVIAKGRSIQDIIMQFAKLKAEEPEE